MVENERPTKTRKLHHEEQNDSKPAMAVSRNAMEDDDNGGDDVESRLGTNASDFLFRSPADSNEIKEITEKMRSLIETAHSEISKVGYESFRKKLGGGGSVVDSSGDGVDTDDENELDRKSKEKATSITDAVVRGNPRQYQTALVELAKKQNTIVNLGTGQGKTLVALLLIRHFAPAYLEGKQTLFLVPSVALAIQHTTTLEANLPYSVATACHNSTKTVGARERMAEAQILVGTHGAIRDLMMHYHDMFSFQRINLLIIDECHYASGEHGFATIMKNFYHRLPVDERPRVLGLTASPLVTVKSDVDDDKLGHMLGELEKRLDARIACLSRLGAADQGKMASEAEERCIHYHRSKSLPKMPSHENLGMHEGRVKEFNQLLELYDELGPRLTAMYAATVSREISRNRYEGETAEEFALCVEHLNFISELCKEQAESCPNGGMTEKLALLEQLLSEIIEAKGSSNTVGVVFVERRITAIALYNFFKVRTKCITEGTWVRASETIFNRKPLEHERRNTLFAPSQVQKMGKTLDLRNRLFDEDMDYDVDELDNVVIADVLEDALPDGVSMKDIMNLEHSPIAPNHILHEKVTGKQHRVMKCDMIVRQCTQVFKYLDRSHHFSKDKNNGEWLHELRKVKDVLNGLRNKTTNVLIATSVVEEGVDVESCSFVIAFDSIKTTKNYIQMKGRARQTNAKFFVFQDVSPATISNPYMHLRTAQNTDLRIREFISSRPEYTPIVSDPAIEFKSYNDDANAELLAIECGEYRTKIGLVDLSSAKTLLNRYTLSIPLDASFRSTKDSYGIHLPQFEENRLMLPSHIPSSARCVLLPEKYHRSGKKEIQNLLSLMACVRLHKLNLLNDRLLPLKRKDMQNKLLGVALTELFTSGKKPSQKCPPMPTTKNDVYIYKLLQTGDFFQQNDKVLGGDSRSLCLVTLVPLVLGSADMTFQHIEIGQVTTEIMDAKMKQLNGDEWDLCTEFHTVLMNARWRKRTGTSFYSYNKEKVKKGILPPYVVSCLTKDEEIDWNRIRTTIKEYRRSDEEKRDEVRKYAHLQSDLPRPRIWCPIYDPCVSYISYGPSKLDCSSEFPEESENIKTYKDYFVNRRDFEVKNSCTLFAVQRQWYLPRKMQKSDSKSMFDVWKKKLKTDLDLPEMNLQQGERRPCKGLTSALLPIDACFEAPIADAALFLHCLILPQILYYTDQLMVAQLFVEHCVEHLPVLGSHIKSISHESLDDVLEALTAKSCIMRRNYDRLEWLGDAVLKLIHTDALLNSRDLRKWVSFLHEGELSFLRSAMGSNSRLLHASKGAGFDRFILFRQLGRGQYVPIGMELREIQEDGTEALAQVESVQPGKKTSADVIESILGLVYSKIGFQAAYDVAAELGITLPRDPDYNASIPGYKANQSLQDLADGFLGGVKFKHPELLEEAITHPSCVHETVPCYQRLEWVGDAVLCLFARDWIYKTFPHLQVGELVILESTIVCNETLAYLSISSGLQRHLNHRDPSLPSKISNFEAECNQRGLWATDPPKPLSDIVEAMFGAVFVDQGLEAAQASVQFAMNPVVDSLTKALKHRNINDMQSKARAMVHPKQYVHELAGGILNVKSWREDIYSVKKRNIPVWKSGIWGLGNREGSNYIGLIESCGIDLLGIEEQSSHVARNRACAITMEIFEKNPDLIDKLKNLAALVSNKSKPV